MLYTDMLGHSITIDHPPQKIVSLVPSQTELLYDLGLNEEVAGITKFCIHPQAWFRGKTRIGGTKTLNLEKIRGIAPDLIIANKEENEQAQVEALAREFPVWTSDISTLDDALRMIVAVGSMTGRDVTAENISKHIRSGFEHLAPADKHLQTAYLIWKDPYISVGGDTFIHEMLTRAGFDNMFAAQKRYPVVTVDMLQDCELLLLSSEPYPFAQKHIDALQRQLPRTLIMLADGEMFSWYGSRLQKAPAYLSTLRGQILSLADAARNR